MPSFYFERVLQTALNGIDQNVTGPVLQIAGAILILSLLYAVYEAYSNGGDVRALGIAGIKYLVLGLVFLNYQSAFRSVNGMFNSVADFIYNTNGIGDVVQNWLNSVSAYISQQGLSSFWTLVTGAISGFLDVLLILVGLIVLPISYTLFTLAYAMYGSVLYLVGPFVLALWPSRAMGQLSRTYFVNLMIFQSWGLLYAILQVLITALQMNSINAVLGGNGVLNAFIGSSQMILLGAASILFSIAITLIPFLASRIVRGEVGNTFSAVISAAGLYANAATKSLLGSSSSQRAAAGPPTAMSEPGPPTGGGPGSAASGALAESKPPVPVRAESGAAGSVGEIGSGGALLLV
ncbi:MAG TPA: hypothetical protein VHQ22_21880 [Terriglobales bacterium]|nr:hypothetical protein [Terriglobales bacterium]